MMEMSRAAEILTALAQERRLDILCLLVQQGHHGWPVPALKKRVNITPWALSTHLRKLAQAGLVITRQEDRTTHCSANFATLDALIGFLSDCKSADLPPCPAGSFQECKLIPGTTRFVLEHHEASGP
jgi:ArsR family transcriptional regulator, arsenate/arsenite/antimonite-responsive transcriptional repressor